MPIEIICVAAGFAAGMFLQRFLIHMAVRNFPPTICDYCQWKKANEWRWRERKSRHIKK